MDKENTSDAPLMKQPLIKKSRKIYLVWLLPVVAIIFCVFLSWQAWRNQAFEIKIQFDNAQGIIAGKTNVVYNGIFVGQVKKIEATKNLEKVTATVQMDEKLKPWLTDKTDFWLVKPRVSLSGVTGLETLVSGKYIGMRPDKSGKPALTFFADNKAPVSNDTPGLHITLLSDSLHSVSIGSPVYFNRLEVGKVTDYSLARDNKTVLIQAVIFPEYTHLVKHNSRFWNTSGLDFTASLKGVKLRTESISSLLRGGLAFYTPDWEPLSAQAVKGDQFILYSGFEQARAGISIDIRFPLRGAAIHDGTPVMFHGVKVGVIKRVSIDDDLDHFSVQAVMNPDAKSLLEKGACFWIVRPKISFSNTADLDTLFNGPYIAMGVSGNHGNKQYDKTVFEGHDKRPQIPFNTPGLNLVLLTPALDGLQINSPVMYREKTVGNIEQTRLDKDGRHVLVDVNIYPEYQNLVNKSSHFFVQNGISINASLSGVDIKTGPLSTLMSGGILVVTPDRDALPLKQGERVMLASRAPDTRESLSISLTAPELGSVNKGMPVLYLGVPVGEVTSYRLDNPASQVLIDIKIYSPYEHLVSLQSKFWNVSGLTIEGGLVSGIKVKTDSLEKLIRGAIAFATPRANDKTTPAGTRFKLYATPDEQWTRWHPAISLKDGDKGR